MHAVLIAFQAVLLLLNAQESSRILPRIPCNFEGERGFSGLVTAPLCVRRGGSGTSFATTSRASFRVSVISEILCWEGGQGSLEKICSTSRCLQSPFCRSKGRIRVFVRTCLLGAKRALRRITTSTIFWFRSATSCARSSAWTLTVYTRDQCAGHVGMKSIRFVIIAAA